MSDPIKSGDEIGLQPNKTPISSFRRLSTPIFEYEFDPYEEECYDFLMNEEEEEEINK